MDKKILSISALGAAGDVSLSDIAAVEDCAPGWRANHYNVIVAPSEPKKQVGRILLSGQTSERLELAAQVGRIVSVSPLAFNYEKEWPEDQKPKVGDVVAYARFAGTAFEGADGRSYRVLKDQDVMMICEVSNV